MGFFDSTIQAVLAGRHVKVAPLVKFDFVSGAMYLWPGNGPLTTLDANTWQGTRGIGSISGMDEAIAGSSATEMTFTLSGVNSSVLTLAAGSTAEYIDRMVFIYLQFFDDAWQCLDSPYAFRAGVMTSLEFDRTTTKTGFQRNVTLRAYDFLAGQSRPPYSYYSDRDQQTRYPGDTFFDRMAGLQWKVVRWPDF